MLKYDPILQSCKTALSIQTSGDLNSKRYFIRDAKGFVVRTGTFTGYSNDFSISTCGLKNGVYSLMVEKEVISFKIDTDD
jgi:hypothetical protein